MLRQLCTKLFPRSSPNLLQCRNIRAVPAYRHADKAAKTRFWEVPREKHLILRMDRMICLRKFSEALEVFRGKIAELCLPEQQMEEIYEAACQLFLQHKCVNEALDLYEDMQTAGYRGSFKLQSTMLFIRCARSDQKAANLVEDLRSQMEAMQENLTEPDLLTLLNQLSKHGHDYDILVRIVDHFLSLQKPSYRLGPATITHLINNSPKDPSSHEAKQWLRYHRDNVRNSSIPSHIKDAHPYTAFIHSNFKRRGYGKLQYDRILRYMSEDGVSADSGLLNVLIQIEVRRRDYSLAFQLYNTMSKERIGSVQANEFTYCSLFAALENLSTQSINASISLIPARRLFHEMLRAFRFGLPSGYDGPDSLNILGLPALNQALKVFMNSGDYAGAIIVLQTIAQLGLEINMKTINAVIRTLAQRVHREAFTSEREVTWSDHFMCLQEGDKEQIRKLPHEQIFLRVEQVGQIIAELTDPTIQKFETPYRLPWKKRMEQSSSSDQISSRYVHFLLEVLIWRALEASVGSVHDLASSREESSRDSQGQVETEYVSAARKVMVPELEVPVTVIEYPDYP